MQQLWDRGEANGYAQHMTSDPLPNTPPHEVLLHPALGDHQVAQVTAEVEARTIGAFGRPNAVDHGPLVRRRAAVRHPEGRVLAVLGLAARDLGLGPDP